MIEGVELEMVEVDRSGKVLTMSFKDRTVDVVISEEVTLEEGVETGKSFLMGCGSVGYTNPLFSRRK